VGTVVQRTKAVTTTQATSLTTTLGSNVTTGNLLIALITVTSGSSGITMPGGWTLRASDTAQSCNTFIYDHTTTGTADKSLVLTLPAGGAAVYLIEAAGLMGFDLASVTSSATSASTYTASVTPTTASSYVIGFTSYDTAAVTTSFSGSSNAVLVDETAQAGSTSQTFHDAYGESNTTQTTSVAVTVTTTAAVQSYELIAAVYKATTAAPALQSIITGQAVNRSYTY
jgi:hypothetical protein